ncbi:MAG: hypothetical protein O8C63_10340, partial [Candidatus Methanoperedens sp.]|nr:hypothetical protein [Candidatus Methanoperedens sp.]
MITIKDLPDENLFTAGHTACPGCGVAMSIRNAIRVLGKDTSVSAVAAGSLSLTFELASSLAARAAPDTSRAIQHTTDRFMFSS